MTERRHMGTPWVLGVVLTFGGVTALVWGAAVAETPDAQGGKPTMVRGLIQNEDCSNYFMVNGPDDMDVEGLHAFIDRYANTQLTHFFLNPNAMRTSFDSKVRDHIWGSGDPEPGIAAGRFSESGAKWARHTYRLQQACIDPYAVWIDRCRKHGISPWISMRMNDCHENNDTSSYLHSTFWVEHPEYWRGGTGYFARCMDYGAEEVREHHMALVREYLERYDLDGLELDWMRECFCFKPGEEEKGRAILTAFMRDVRALADKRGAERGRPIKIAARVPALPEASYGWGLDGVAWAKEGLVDILVPTARWATADFDIPVDRWRALLGDAAEHLSLAAGMEIRIQPYPGASAIMSTPETLRGFSAAALERGADQVYLFNHMHSLATSVDDILPIFTEAGCLETVIDKPRRHVVTYRDIAPPGVAVPNALPAELASDSPGRFSIYIGPPPETGSVVVRVGLSEAPGMKEAQLAVRVNAVDCPADEDHPTPGQFCGAARILQFDAPLAAMTRGYNEVEIALKGGDGQRIVWMEFYLVP
jgi:hypothetical protein